MVIPADKSWYIYGLTDQTGRIRYVGKSANPQGRYQQHTRPSRFDNTHRGRWLAGLRQRGIKPGLVILEKLPDQGKANEAERRWIASFPDLVNISTGGDGFVGLPSTVKRGRKPGFRHSEYFRSHLSSLMRERGQHPPHPSTFSAETKSRVAEGMRRFRANADPAWLTEESARNAATARAQWQNPTVRARMQQALSVAQQHRFASPEERAKCRQGAFGTGQALCQRWRISRGLPCRCGRHQPQVGLRYKADADAAVVALGFGK